jgi:preprotein translocase subunit YajC
MMPLLSIILQAQGRPSMLPFLIQFGAIIAIFWFLLIRPQRRMAQKHREVLAALKRNDEVMTEGGIIGTVVHITEDRVTIKTAENTRLVVARAKIARVLNAEAQAGEAK